LAKLHLQLVQPSLFYIHHHLAILLQPQLALVGLVRLVPHKGIEQKTVRQAASLYLGGSMSCGQKDKAVGALGDAEV